MTKSITVAERQTRDFAEKKYTVGLDRGDRWSWFACWMNVGMWCSNTN
jgi:hypothetical protein